MRARGRTEKRTSRARKNEGKKGYTQDALARAPPLRLPRGGVRNAVDAFVRSSFRYSLFLLLCATAGVHVYVYARSQVGRYIGIHATIFRGLEEREEARALARPLRYILCGGSGSTPRARGFLFFSLSFASGVYIASVSSIPRAAAGGWSI